MEVQLNCVIMKRNDAKKISVNFCKSNGQSNLSRY